MKMKKKSKVNYIIPIAAMLIVAAVIVMLALFVKDHETGKGTDAETTDTNALADTTCTESGTEEESLSDDTSSRDTSDESGTDDKTTDDATTDSALPPSVDDTDGGIVICLDAGHGFDDVGCSTELLDDVEAVITLDIVERVSAELSKHNVTVILTHDGKVFPSASEIRSMSDKYGLEYDSGRIIDNNIFSAYERVIYANAVNKETPIDFFVSIHVNSIVGYPEISRYEMFYYEGSPYTELLTEFTDSIRDVLDNDSVTIAKGPTDAYTVTRWADFPSLLIETGYATNTDDAAKLNSADWRQSFAELLAAEILSVTGAK